MKRFISILLIALIACSAFSVMAISAFAEETGNKVVDDTLANTGKVTDTLNGVFEKVKAYVPMDELMKFKNEATVFVKALILFVKSEETYKNIATAILGVLAFIFIPIIIGIVVAAYIAATLMTVCASVIVKIAEIVLGIIIGMIPV